MKLLSYPRIAKEALCLYGIAEHDGKRCVLFIQGPSTQTSVANAIEANATGVLFTDLAGTNPDSVRFFVHYPSQIIQFVGWKEVRFRKHSLVGDEPTLILRLLRFWPHSAPQRPWAVSGPAWITLSEENVPPHVLAMARS